MPQSSLLTWLNKPDAVTQPQPLPKASNGDDLLARETGTIASTRLNNDSEKSGESAENNGNLRSTKFTGDDSAALPENVEFRACTQQDLNQLKHLTRLLLPIGYPDSFFREIVSDPITNDITLLAFWHDTVPISSQPRGKGRLVGAVRCRLLNAPSAPLATAARKSGPMLYLSTLVLLSPYRQHGIATWLVDTVTRRAAKVHGVTSVGAHVWVANEDGLAWYRKRGFVEIGQLDDYYKQLSPSGAVIMQKSLGVLDWI